VSTAKEISPDDAKLRELGFDPGASAPDALGKLRELRTNAAASPLAVARALGAIADPGAAAMLVEMEAGASGALRREIRRSIFKLRQRGIEVHEPARQPSKAPAPAPSDSGLSAFMSPIDAEGAQIVWMVKARPQGGVLRLWALIAEDEGLAGVQNHSLTRREFKTQREELEKQASVKLIEIDPGLADFIVCDAYRRTPESRRGQVGNFYALRTEVTGAPPPTDYQNRVYSQLAAEAAGEPSADLMKEPEIAEIRIPVEQLKPYIDEVNRAQESVLVVSRASQSERIMAAVEKAIAELLSGERAQLLLKTGRRQPAGWAVAAAARIRDGADLKQVPFFRTLVQAQLAALIAQETERKQEEPRLIMTPAEAMRAQQERQARMRGPRR
jgi:hypothetical protein